MLIARASLARGDSRASERQWAPATLRPVATLEASLLSSPHTVSGALRGMSEAVPVKAPFEGIVIGFTSNPLVYRGDALLHVARASRSALRTPSG